MVRWPFRHTNVFAIVLIIMSTLNDSTGQLDNSTVPCNFHDSINITSGDVNSDGSVMFKGISYPEKYHGIYDYEFIDGSYRQKVAPHKRGCICTMDTKPCVRMCCPRGQYLELSSKKVICVENDGVFNMSVRVSDGDASSAGNIFDSFNHVVGKPCESLFVMEPNSSEHDTWVLLKNGNILIGKSSIATIDKNHYCLNARESNGSFETVLITCYEEVDRTSDFWVSCAMFLSIPFLLATIAVYTILPELRNLHGKSLVCYLSGLVVGYVTLGLIKLKGQAFSEQKLCQTMGYTTYFAFLFAFFWSSVISFDLWRSFWFTFRNRESNDSKKFAYYSIYAWGSTLLMLSICLGLDNSTSVSTEFKSGIGISNCFLGNMGWSSFIYFYLPLIIISISNLTFFVLTSWKIRIVRRDMQKFANNEESEVYRQTLKKEKSNHVLFMRIFIVMGVTWSVEPISWIISSEGGSFLPTYIMNLMNAAQGVIIFFLFVIRVNVKMLIVKRWQIWRGKSRRRVRPSACRDSISIMLSIQSPMTPNDM